MTSENEIKRNSARATLPWLVAAAGLVIYLLTLNHWVTLGNLGQVVQQGGWNGQVPFFSPLYFAVTYPLRWLPAAWQPLGLNLFAAICAVLTLGLLARSVMLLPHDRTREQRLREHSDNSVLSIRAAWLPPVLAVLVCGLQLTFWENATTGTAEMFDLLLFAYVIRCLLEYRVTQRASWLTRFALAYGLTIPNNWAMIGFAPAFLVALVWIKGMGFFNWRFIGRMAGCGAVGLLLYLLLPMLHSTSKMSDASFWQVLGVNLQNQKGYVHSAFFLPRHIMLLVGLTSILPVFMAGLNWASSLGDTNVVSIKLTTWTFYIVHGLFLAACLIVPLDLAFSPLSLAAEMPFKTSFLTLYYLGALSAGYYSGYFLLVFGTKPQSPRSRTTFAQRAINRVITLVIWIALIGVPARLIFQNLPAIRANQVAVLSQYADLLAKSLPAKGALVLADDPTKLYLLAAKLHQQGMADKYVLLDTRLMQLPSYQKFLSNQYPQHGAMFITPSHTNQLIDQLSLIKMLLNFSHSNDVYYIHPSFGYYFEPFYPRPHGLTYELKTYPTNSIDAPILTSNEITENQTFWEQIERETLSPLPSLVKRRSTPAILVATFYSRALDFWGVELQRVGQFEDAGAIFERALELNPDNVVVQVNLNYNRDRRTGKKTPIKSSNLAEDEFEKYRGNMVRIVTDNGPFDEPNYCFEQGRIFAKGRDYRQAAQQFERAMTLAPDHLPARLWLGQLMVMGQMPDKVLELVADTRAHSDTLSLDQSNQIELIRLEAAAYLVKTNSEAVDKLMQAALAKYPEDKNLLLLMVQVQMRYGRLQDAMTTIEKLLKIAPDEPQALLNKGALSIQLKTFKEAIEPLTRLLTLQPENYAALLDRAIANLQLDEYEAAKADYEKLRIAFPTAFQIYYGLGEIAFRKKETQTAIKNYELYLKYAPTNSEEQKMIGTRLQELKSSSP